MRLGAYLYNRRQQWGAWVFPEVRVRMRERRYLIPDLSVVVGDRPLEPILTTPPLLWIEILSPDDQPERVAQKVPAVLTMVVL